MPCLRPTNSGASSYHQRWGLGPEWLVQYRSHSWMGGCKQTINNKYVIHVIGCHMLTRILLDTITCGNGWQYQVQSPKGNGNQRIYLSKWNPRDQVKRHVTFLDWLLYYSMVYVGWCILCANSTYVGECMGLWLSLVFPPWLQVDYMALWELGVP